MHFKFRFIHFAPYVVYLVESLQRLTFRNGESSMHACAVCPIMPTFLSLLLHAHSSFFPSTYLLTHTHHSMQQQACRHSLRRQVPCLYGYTHFPFPVPASF